MKMRLLLPIAFLWLACATLYAKEAQTPLLNVEHWQTANGVNVYFVAAPALPILDMQILFDAGSSREGNRAGIARITNALLRAGGKDDTTDSIAEAFSSIGAEIAVDSRRDMASLTLRTLSNEPVREQALSLVTKMLKPAFKTADFEREKTQLLKVIQQKQDYPGRVAQDLFFKSLYGTHPYAHPSEGTPESVNLLTVENAYTFFKQFYVSKNATLILVGAITRDEAIKIASSVSAVLQSGEKASPLPEPVIPTSTALHHAMPTQQSHVLFGALGGSRFDEEWPALYLGNEILGGGGFDSRLFADIREKEGLAYQVGSYFIPMQSRGPWLASLETRYEMQEVAVEHVKQLVSDFLVRGPSEKEVLLAKQAVINEFPLRFRSNQSILGQVAAIAFYDLPVHYYDNLLSAIQQTTKKDIQAAYQKYFSEQNFVTVVVGQEVVKNAKESKPTS